MYFRAMLLPTLFTVPALIILIALGSWQLQRLTWKTGLIAELEAAATAPPIRLDELGPPQENRFRRVQLIGSFDHNAEIFLTGRTYEGNAGFHVVTPFSDESGLQILVNRGWVSEEYRPQEKRAFSLTPGETELEAIIRLPQKRGYFVPENEPERGFWFTLIPQEIAAFQGRPAMQTGYYADAIRVGEVITLPIAARVRIDLPNAHLNYALTWFGLALSLLGVYIAFHHAQGRLGFGRPPAATQSKRK